MQVRIRVGVILALAAWIMQLSVFLTPIFASQLGLSLGVGYGICDELAAFSPAPAPSTRASPASHAAMAGMPMSGMSMADMAAMPEMAGMAATTPHDSSSLDLQHPITHPSHHPSHGLCGFCLLLGHSVLPPSFSLGTLNAQHALLLRSMRVASDYRRFIPVNKTLRPQGRAPPFDFISVRPPLF